MKITPSPNWITKDTEKSLRMPCENVDFPLSQEDLVCIEKMISYIDASFFNKSNKYGIRPGIGIAAPQIGYNKKMSYIRLTDIDNKEHKYLMINPEIIEKSYNMSYLEHGEGCLSVDEDKKGIVPRHETIKVRFYDYFEKKIIEKEFTNLIGICFQHEIDHLNSKLYYDRINPFDKFYTSIAWKKIS
jgi:peptide deformylase